MKRKGGWGGGESRPRKDTIKDREDAEKKRRGKSSEELTREAEERAKAKRERKLGRIAAAKGDRAKVEEIRGGFRGKGSGRRNRPS